RADATLTSAATISAPWRAARIEIARPLPIPGPGLWPAPTTTTTLPDRSKAVRSLRSKSKAMVLLGGRRGPSPRLTDQSYRWYLTKRTDLACTDGRLE